MQKYIANPHATWKSWKHTPTVNRLRWELLGELGPQTEAELLALGMWAGKRCINYDLEYGRMFEVTVR